MVVCMQSNISTILPLFEIDLDQYFKLEQKQNIINIKQQHGKSTCNIRGVYYLYPNYRTVGALNVRDQTMCW